MHFGQKNSPAGSAELWFGLKNFRFRLVFDCLERQSVFAGLSSSSVNGSGGAWAMFSGIVLKNDPCAQASPSNRPRTSVV